MGKFSDKDIERTEEIRARAIKASEELSKRHADWIVELSNSDEPYTDENIQIAKQYYKQFHHLSVELGAESSIEDFITQMILMMHLDMTKMNDGLKEQQDMIYDLSAEIEQLVELIEKLKEE